MQSENIEGKGVDIEAAKFGLVHAGDERIVIEVAVKLKGVTHKDERFNAFSFVLEERISAEEAIQIAELIPVRGQKEWDEASEREVFFAGWKLDREGLEAAILESGTGGELSKFALMKLVTMGAIDRAVKVDGVLTK
ncbi:MAG: hypothetical protein ACRCT2_02315 [Plesiomonas shigelloides]